MKMHQNLLLNSKSHTIQYYFQRLRRKLLFLYVNLFDENAIHKSDRLKSMHGEFCGQRCFIMGNGPSLNKMDLGLFKDEYVWGSNRCYLLFNKLKWRPKFYTAVDKRVVPDNANEIGMLSKELPGTRFFYPVEFLYNGILNSAKNTFWYDEKELDETSLPYGMFSLDPSKYVYSVRTVTIAMMQLGVFLGFNPIYLIGCDTNYKVPKTVKFENGNSDLIISTEADQNHFDSSYFGKDKRWHEPHVDRMIFHYEQAKKVCDEVNVQIFNATVGGNLEVFPRINYLDLF